MRSDMLQRGWLLLLQGVCVCALIQNITWINMNDLESSRIHMSWDESIPIYTNLYDIMRSDVLQRREVLLLQRVCVN